VTIGRYDEVVVPVEVLSQGDPPSWSKIDRFEGIPLEVIGFVPKVGDEITLDDYPRYMGW
jgi:hypothetical protein